MKQGGVYFSRSNSQYLAPKTILIIFVILLVDAIGSLIIVLIISVKILVGHWEELIAKHCMKLTTKLDSMYAKWIWKKKNALKLILKH